MKMTLKSLVIAALLLVSASAFSQKIGYVDYVSIISAMPEKGEADQGLEKYARDLEKQRQNMEMEYTQKLTTLQNEADTLSEMIINIRAKELQDLEQRINDFSQAAQQDIVAKREQLYAPILDKVDDAIKAVAEELGMKFVLEKSNLLYAAETEDITTRVKSRLGIE
jgi:outer membrane protein